MNFQIYAKTWLSFRPALITSKHQRNCCANDLLGVVKRRRKCDKKLSIAIRRAITKAKRRKNRVESYEETSKDRTTGSKQSKGTPSRLDHLKSKCKLLKDECEVKRRRAQDCEDIYTRVKGMSSFFKSRLDVGITECSSEQMLQFSKSIEDDDQRMAIVKRIYKVGQREEKKLSGSIRDNSFDCNLCNDRRVEWVLWCGHTICSLCYADILDSQMSATCPYCKEVTTEGGGIEMI